MSDASEINLNAFTRCESCGGIVHRESGCPYCLTGKYAAPGDSADPVLSLPNPPIMDDAPQAPFSIPATAKGETGFLFTT